MQNRPLEGKIALVTGAGSPIGFGRHMTLALVRAGARVAMLDINDEWLEQTSSDMQEVGGDDCVLTMVADVSKPEAAEDAVRRTISGLGGLHILLNNAGISAGNLGPRRMNFWDINPETWNKVLSVNLSGAFYMARAAVGHMIDQKWGRIIGVTTSMDTMYREGMSPYGPSKAGHEAFIALMSRELEGSGVTANVLVPGGASDTNIIPPDTPFDRAALIRPEVMQDPVVWLASEASNAINGRRFIARLWDETLPIEERLEKAGAPAAWPQLGRQSVAPGRE